MFNKVLMNLMFTENNYQRLLAITTLILLINTSCLMAQNKPSPRDTAKKTDMIDLNTDLEKSLLPLEEIMDIAVRNSPYIKYDSAMMMRQRYNIRIQRRDWQKMISATGFYSWGNQTLSYGQDQGYSYSVLNGYRYGINVNIPLSDVTARGAKIKLSKAEYEAQRFKKDQSELMLRRQVIEEYTNLIGAQRILKVRNEGRENARLTYEMAEKQFKEGGIVLSDMTDATDSMVTAETEYQTALTEYRIILLSFEELVGVKLSNLMRTTK